MSKITAAAACLALTAAFLFSAAVQGRPDPALLRSRMLALKARQDRARAEADRLCHECSGRVLYERLKVLPYLSPREETELADLQDRVQPLGVEPEQATGAGPGTGEGACDGRLEEPDAGPARNPPARSKRRAR